MDAVPAEVVPNATVPNATVPGTGVPNAAVVKDAVLQASVFQGTTRWFVLGAVILVLVLVVVLIAVARHRGRQAQRDAHGPRRLGRRRPPREHFRPEGAPGQDSVSKRRAAVIVNPTKFQRLDAVRAQVTRGCHAAGWDDPLWIETTVEDPGTGQARRAVEEGVTVVCALGGDGTVRSVAAALVGTETPMGLLPAGTGNLLARNLQLPVDSLDDALRIALTGQNKRVDVGRLSVEPDEEHQRPDEHIFLVMAGMGFDATVMATVPEKLKSQVGWLAYGFAGLQNLRGARFRMRMTVDDEEEFSRRVRTVVVGNCGKLTGGLVLMPRAELDDGLLDAVVLSPNGIVSWAAVAARVITKTRRGHDRVDHRRGRTMTLRVDRAQDVQLDGDPIGTAYAMSTRVDPGALVVRVG